MRYERGIRIKAISKQRLIECINNCTPLEKEDFKTIEENSDSPEKVVNEKQE